MAILYTIEEHIARLNNLRGRLSNAVSLLNTLKAQREQMIREKIETHDIDADMTLHLGDIKTITAQAKIDITTIDDVIGVNPVVIKAGMTAENAAGVPVVIHHFAITTTTIEAQDRADAVLDAFKDVAETGQMFTVNDRVELKNAENPENNSIVKLHGTTIADEKLTFVAAIPSGVANTDDETIEIHLLEVV